MKSYLIYGCIYTRLLLTTVVSVMAGDSAAGSTTAASPIALESVTGSCLTATTRLRGSTRVRSSCTITSLFRSERLRGVLPLVCLFFVFFVFVFFAAIKNPLMSARNRYRCLMMGTLQRHRIARCAYVLPTFRAVCGTRDVNHATAVRASKLLQQYKTCGEVIAAWLRSL
jgi:hypothetical protein